MPNLTLNANIGQEALTLLKQSGLLVVVGKMGANGAPPNVAWLAFQPFSANMVTWEEEYSIYASTTAIQNGATLQQLSTTPFPAATGQVYPLTAQGFFGPPQGGGAPGLYTALNQFNNPGGLTFGLAQNARVNGQPMNGNAVSAVATPFQTIIALAPSTTVYIWVQQQVRSGTVVTHVSAPQTAVEFTGGVTQATVVYDLNSGHFVRS
ncbi:MAG TPA: hypothetical protein VGP73_19555 [Thermoanaerobaculia bacterium]